MAADGFALNKVSHAFGNIAPGPDVSRGVVCIKRRTEVDGVFAILGANRVDALVDPTESFDLERRAEQVRLAVRRTEVEERDHGRTIERARGEQGIERRLRDREEFVCEIGRAREMDLDRLVFERLCAQENEHLPGLEAVLSRTHAGGFDVLGELGEDEPGIVGRGREGLHLLYGRVCGTVSSQKRQGGYATEFRTDLFERFRQERVETRVVRSCQVESGPDAKSDKRVGRTRADAPDIPDGKFGQVGRDLPVRDRGESVRLLPFRSRLGEDLGRCESDGEREAEFAPQIFLDSLGHHVIIRAQRSLPTGDIGKAFVDAVFFHVGREAADDIEESFGKKGIGLIVGREDDDIRTDLTDLMKSHRPGDTERFGFVAHGRGDITLRPGDDGLASECRVARLFAGSKERVPVDMEDGSGIGSVREKRGHSFVSVFARYPPAGGYRGNPDVSRDIRLRFQFLFWIAAPSKTRARDDMEYFVFERKASILPYDGGDDRLDAELFFRSDNLECGIGRNE